MIILVCQAGCSSTTVEPKEEVETVKEKSTKRSNPVLCALLFLKLDCTPPKQNKVKVQEAEPHAVPEEEPITETITVETKEG